MLMATLRLMAYDYGYAKAMALPNAKVIPMAYSLWL